MIRLQKVMADRGVASRRRAEELITEGRVRVDGELVTTLGTRVPEDARIEVDGRPVAPAPAHRYILMNKPVGIVSTAHDEHGRRTVVDHLGARERLYPVGRLDTDSEGLLLLTNDGTWAERVLHPRYGHEREYDVSVEGDLTDEGLARLQRGIPLEEGIARAVRVAVRSRSRGRSRLSMVLLTGWKRQVRRMCLAVGVKVTRLVRVRMGPLELGRLRPGEFRDLTKKEIDAMTAPAARAETARPIAARVVGRTVMPVAPRATPRDTGRTRAPNATSRERGWIATPPVTRRVAVSRASGGGPQKGLRAAPRVTRRGAVSRARVEGPRRQPNPQSESSQRRAAAPRAPARGGTPTRRGGVPREKRVSTRRHAALDRRA